MVLIYFEYEGVGRDSNPNLLRRLKVLLLSDNHYLKMLSIGDWSGMVEIWDKAFSMVRYRQTHRQTDREKHRQTDWKKYL